MTDTTCSCCGEHRLPAELAALSCHAETTLCRGCVHWLAGQFEGSTPFGSATPILPVRDMAEAIAFWTATGLSVHPYDDGYTFVNRNGELLHLATDPTLDPARNSSACYIHEPDVSAVHARWQAAGLPVSELLDQPWGMREFSVRDPSGNLIRVGTNL
jgi:uncharacterized glyoxalase superfamily protein PhnB